MIFFVRMRTTTAAAKIPAKAAIAMRPAVGTVEVFPDVTEEDDDGLADDADAGVSFFSEALLETVSLSSLS